jgi:hypothetical protein
MPFWSTWVGLLQTENVHVLPGESRKPVKDQEDLVDDEPPQIEKEAVQDGEPIKDENNRNGHDLGGDIIEGARRELKQTGGGNEGIEGKDKRIENKE